MIEHFKELPPVPTRDEEIVLGKKAQAGSRKARHALLLPNIRLAKKIAREYMNLGVDDDDLLSEAVIGVEKATTKYDPDRGPFSVCAQFYIRGQIRKHISDVGFGMKKPVYFVDRINKVRRAEMDLRHTLDRDPTNEELAQKTGMKLPVIETCRKGFARVTSMDEHVDRGVGQEEFGRDRHSLAEDPSPGPDTLAEFNNSRAIVLGLLRQLPARTRDIVAARFGIGRPEQTLQEVADRYGISRERVRQIEEQALAGLRSIIRNRDPWFYGQAVKIQVEPRRTCGCGRIIINGDECRQCYPILKLPIAKPKSRKLKRIRRAA